MTAQQPTDSPHVVTVLLPGAIGGAVSRSQRKPKSELRHWSTYRSVTEWFADYRGYVPVQMAAGLARVLRANPGMTFPEAYGRLRHAGAIIELEPDDEPPGKRLTKPYRGM